MKACQAAHRFPLINQLLWLKRNETELQFGLNNFHSGLTKATSLVDSNFSFWLVQRCWFRWFLIRWKIWTKNDFSQSTVWFYFINYSRSFRIILSKRKTITGFTIYRAGTVHRYGTSVRKKSDITPVWLVVWESDVPVILLSQMKNGNITLFRNPEWFWMILNYSELFWHIFHHYWR